ncbi:MAG: aminoglycoside phosphotransferase family protein [Patescibacteria group bacterium]
MEKIEKLFDSKYVLSFFNKKVLPLYPDFKKIKKIKIVPHKKFVWPQTYHVVIEFKVFFLAKTENKNKESVRKLSFFCTAHSSEPRKNVYDILDHLWSQGFSKGFLTIPKPILYSKYFNASFYRGVDGISLLDLIKNKEKKEVEKIVKKTAEWLAKLHKMPFPSDIKLNKKNNQIKTVVPGYRKIIKEVDERYEGKYTKNIRDVYEYLIELEEDFLKMSHRRWLIHGDVHPDNIIKISKNKMAMIDFADICSSDFARDLGTFLQQIEYRLNKNNYPISYIKKIKDIFLTEYCKKARIKYNIRLKERINLYYHFTALRTAIFWLMKHGPDSSKAEPLIIDIKKKLKIC